MRSINRLTGSQRRILNEGSTLANLIISSFAGYLILMNHWAWGIMIMVVWIGMFFIHHELKRS